MASILTFERLKNLSPSRIKRSIRRRIVAIAVGLIVLMVGTTLLSMFMVGQLGDLLDELTGRYMPANSQLTRISVLSLDRAIEVRRMVIALLQDPPDEAAYERNQQLYEAKGVEMEDAALAARNSINSIIADESTPSDNAELARIETRVAALMGDSRRHLREISEEMLTNLEARDFVAVRRSLVRVDSLRDELNEKIDAVRRDMLEVSTAAIEKIRLRQLRLVYISAIATVLASIIGLLFANLVSGGIIRSVKKLLDGTRAVEAGQLDESIDVATGDEIGQLADAFNRMVVQLRHNQRVKETFGKYIDPRVVEGLIDSPNLTAAEGERRVMTVVFCDLRGFTGLSKGMTPQGLVRVMNRYLSIMSEPIRGHRGIIDKYIGDGIMGYWGPPFVDEGEHASLACLAVLEMIDRIAMLRVEMAELLGVRGTAVERCDLRIGIATGDALVGSIGSEFMMSYTVMGDVVNFASRLEGANKTYDTRNLVSEKTAAAVDDVLVAREIDRIVVAGHTHSEVVFELLGRKGELAPQQVKMLDCYHEGLAAYREQRWDDALHAFGSALSAMPGDGPSTTLVARIEGIKAGGGLPADWDGSWTVEK